MNYPYLSLIRNKRLEKGLSQEYVSSYLEISQKTYSDIENGQTLLKRQYIIKLSEILDVPPTELCIISEHCNSCKSKNEELIQLLKKNGIEISPELL
ncbi:MAG TPA: helix-turn-helix transcriptional regulator [Chitinophagales bacterium]|nr:helix-turn-helix transcriptional regulator [Chitinophagales bacterium]